MISCVWPFILLDLVFVLLQRFTMDYIELEEVHEQSLRIALNQPMSVSL